MNSIRFEEDYILLSCSFLIYMDRSRYMNQLVDYLNTVPSEVTGMREISAHLDSYVAELEQIDIEQFRTESEIYESAANTLLNAHNDQELDEALNSIFKTFDTPWVGDFDAFMGNRDNHLVFE